MEDNHPEPSLIARPKRPLRVTLLADGVLIIAVLNLLRMEQAAAQYQFLARLQPISPLYQVVTGLVWGAAGLVLFWGLWTGRRWAPLWTRILAVIYVLYYWIDRLFVQNSASRLSNGVFTAVGTVIILAILWIVLSTPKAKAFFGGSHVRP